MDASYNGVGFGEEWSKDDRMQRIVTTLRCVPRFGYAYTEVRTVDLDVTDAHNEQELRRAVARFFAAFGIQDAVYDVDVDDDGYFAIINDEAYQVDWGEPVF